MCKCEIRLIFLLLLLPATGFGQSYEWFNRLDDQPGPDPGSTLYTDLFQVAPTEYGTYAIGRTECDYPVCYGLLTKYDSDDGSLMWRRTFTVYSRTEPFALAVSDAGVFVAGRSDEPGAPAGANQYGGFVRLYSHDGDTLWTKRDARYLHEAWDLVADADGVYVAGSQRGINTRAVVRRLSNDGQVLWTRVMSSTSDSARYLHLDNGRLYVVTGDNSVKTLRASDGAWIGSFGLHVSFYLQDVNYYDGFLYIVDYSTVKKYSLDGHEMWRYTFDRVLNGLGSPASVVTSDDGVFVAAYLVSAFGQDDPNINGSAIVHFELDGSVREIVGFPGHFARPNYLALRDGVMYATGSIGNGTAYTARYSDKNLLRPSLLALAGPAPATPPRLTVLHHDFGAGPVRVALRDAAPGSLEYRLNFSDGLTPVGFDKVADLNGNGYEELVLTSRLPAVTEIRDSLDGSLVTRIPLGDRFDPIAATVEQRAGQTARLAIAVRNKNNNRVLVRVHDLPSGALLLSRDYHPGFDPIDIVALPDVVSNGEYRYALLMRNTVPGSPNKIEIKGSHPGAHANLWLGTGTEPMQLANTVMAEGRPGLAVLLENSSTQRAIVRELNLWNRDQVKVLFGHKIKPVALAVLPDTNGNDFSQLSVISADPHSLSVLTETRDGATGTRDHNVYSGRYYRPEDVTYIGVVPGFSDSAFAALGFRHRQGVFRASIADAATGTKAFDLEFFAEP